MVGRVGLDGGGQADGAARGFEREDESGTVVVAGPDRGEGDLTGIVAVVGLVSLFLGEVAGRGPGCGVGVPEPAGEAVCCLQPLGSLDHVEVVDGNASCGEAGSDARDRIGPALQPAAVRVDRADPRHRFLVEARAGGGGIGHPRCDRVHVRLVGRLVLRPATERGDRVADRRQGHAGSARSCGGEGSSPEHGCQPAEVEKVAAGGAEDRSGVEGHLSGQERRGEHRGQRLVLSLAHRQAELHRGEHHHGQPGDGPPWGRPAEQHAEHAG